MAIFFVSGSQAQATDTTVVVTKPVGLVDGDVMIASVWSEVTTLPTAPAGWTLLHGAPNSLSYDAVFYKVVTNASGESANYTFTAGAGHKTGTIVVYRGVSQNNPIATHSYNFATTGEALSATPVTTIRDGSMILAFYGIRQAVTLTTPAGMTLRVAETINSTTVQAAELTQVLSGATATHTSTANSGGIWSARQIALNEAPDNEITFVAAATNTTNGAANNTVNKPAGTVDGDLMIMVGVCNGDLMTAPAGWTLLQSEVGNPAWYVWYRIASSEGASYMITHAINDSIVGIVTYRGAYPAAPINVSADQYTAGSLITIDVPDAVSTTNNGVAVHIGSLINETTILTAHSRTTSRIKVENQPGISAVLGISDELLGNAGVVTGRDWTMSASKPERYGVLVVVAPVQNIAPVSILISPEDDSVQTLASGYTFDWTFSDPDIGDTQSAWAIRRKVGAGAYEYYDAVAETWGGALVWNTGSTSQYTFPASKWDKNTTYLWSINTKDDLGAAGVFADDFTVISSGAEGWDTLFI